jgi:hypothetical protein
MDRHPRQRRGRGRERRGQGLALAGRHLGDHAAHHGVAADELDVVVALTERSRILSLMRDVSDYPLGAKRPMPQSAFSLNSHAC